MITSNNDFHTREGGYLPCVAEQTQKGLWGAAVEFRHAVRAQILIYLGEPDLDQEAPPL